MLSKKLSLWNELFDFCSPLHCTPNTFLHVFQLRVQQISFSRSRRADDHALLLSSYIGTCMLQFPHILLPFCALLLCTQLGFVIACHAYYGVESGLVDCEIGIIN
jgi:hypothetical protein